jgi:prepilin-type N-terminal cleavage/methylation domain-containing protein
MRRLKNRALRRDEQGYTLQEVLTVIAILGILIVIAVIIFLELLERWRVDAATDQLVADLRLAHESATNQLTDWRVVLDPKKTEDNVPDYYLVKLRAPYPGSAPEVVERTPRTFPANVKVENIAGDLDTGSGWIVPPSVENQTRTLEFNSDGAMKFYQAVGGSTCVTTQAQIY